MWSLLKRHRILVFFTLICVAMVLIAWLLRAETAEPVAAAGVPASSSAAVLRV